MGKKGSLLSAIKRAFSPDSKEKLGNEAERKSGKEKRKKGFGKLKRGESSSFLPIFREPSSIEKILAEAERDHNLVFRPPTPDRSNPPSASPPPQVPSPRVGSPQAASPQSPPPREDLSRLDSPRSLSLNPPDQSNPSSAPSNTPLKPGVPSQRLAPPIVPSPRPTSPRVVSPQAVSIKAPSPKVASPQAVPPKPPTTPREDPLRLETLREPSPKTLPRVELSTLDAPKAEPSTLDALRTEPTLLVQHASATKIQTAFRGYTARKSFRALKGQVRLQGVVKGYSVKRQTVNAMKYMQKLVRVQSKIQSHRTKMSENQTQVEKDEAKWAASEACNDHWDDSVLTKEERDARSQRKVDAIIKRERSMAYAYSHKVTPKSAQDVRTSGGLPLWWNWGDQQLPLASPVPSHYRLTPARLSPSPLSQSSNQHRFKLDNNNFDSSTPKSSRSTLSRPFTSRYSRGRLRGSPFKDDDSLISCPPFPSYMAPTVSAKAKVRPNSNPKERMMGTPSSVSSEKRRMSYPPVQQGQDLFRWNKGSLLMSNKGPGSPGGVVALEKHKTVKSVGSLSIDSTVSMPRKPFNIYV